MLAQLGVQVLGVLSQRRSETRIIANLVDDHGLTCQAEHFARLNLVADPLKNPCALSLAIAPLLERL
jgi:hypothetical protein